MKSLEEVENQQALFIVLMPNNKLPRVEIGPRRALKRAERERGYIGTPLDWQVNCQNMQLALLYRT